MLTPMKTTPKHGSRTDRRSLVLKPYNKKILSLKSWIAKKKSQNSIEKIDSIIKSISKEHHSSSHDFLKTISKRMGKESQKLGVL